MKIAFFSDCYLDLTGGIVSTINAEKAELEKRGHTVEIFSSAYPRTKKELAELAEQHIFPVPSCKLIGRGLSPIARRPRIIEKWLQRNHPEIQQFDLYYVHYEAGCSIAGLRLGKKFKIPTVQVMHGREDIGEEKLIPFGFRTLVATLLNWFHSWYLPHKAKIPRDHYLATTIARAKMWTLMVNHANFADLVITPSEHFRQKLEHYGVKRQIISLHHGIKDELLSEKATLKTFKPTEKLNIIWHSRVSGEKRIMDFLKTLNFLEKRYGRTHYSLKVYGPGPDLARAQKYVKRHALKVKFYGATPFPKIWQAMQKSHLDVLVSYGYDTFGMTLIEAAAAGVPAFFCDPDMEEILPRGSFLISRHETPESMAEALNTVFANPHCIQEMSEKMLAFRSQITISHKIDQLEQIFKQLMIK